MIGHQAIAPDGESILLGISCQKIQEYDAVGVGVEDLASIVAALGNVMRQAGNDKSLAPGHTWDIVVFDTEKSQKIGGRGCCPSFPPDLPSPISLLSTAFSQGVIPTVSGQ